MARIWLVRKYGKHSQIVYLHESMWRVLLEHFSASISDIRVMAKQGQTARIVSIVNG